MNQSREKGNRSERNALHEDIERRKGEIALSPAEKLIRMIDFISVKEAAVRVFLSTRTMHRLLDAGDIPSILLGRQRRIALTDFDA